MLRYANESSISIFVINTERALDELVFQFTGLTSLQSNFTPKQLCKNKNKAS